jgi:hypothetical protein
MRLTRLAACPSPRDHQQRRISQQVGEYQRVPKHAAPVTGGQVVAGFKSCQPDLALSVLEH